MTTANIKLNGCVMIALQYQDCCPGSILGQYHPKIIGNEGGGYITCLLYHIKVYMLAYCMKSMSRFQQLWSSNVYKHTAIYIQSVAKHVYQELFLFFLLWSYMNIVWDINKQPCNDEKIYFMLLENKQLLQLLLLYVMNIKHKIRLHATII